MNYVHIWTMNIMLYESSHIHMCIDCAFIKVSLKSVMEVDL